MMTSQQQQQQQQQPLQPLQCQQSQMREVSNSDDASFYFENEYTMDDCYSMCISSEDEHHHQHHHHHHHHHQQPIQKDFMPTFYNPFETKHRRRTSRAQFKILETSFFENTKPNATMRRWLAQKLGMTPRSVQVWFQNRRAKAKSQLKRQHAATISNSGAACATSTTVSHAYLQDDPDDHYQQRHFLDSPQPSSPACDDKELYGLQDHITWAAPLEPSSTSSNACYPGYYGNQHGDNDDVENPHHFCCQQQPSFTPFTPCSYSFPSQDLHQLQWQQCSPTAYDSLSVLIESPDLMPWYPATPTTNALPVTASPSSQTTCYSLSSPPISSSSLTYSLSTSSLSSCSTSPSPPLASLSPSLPSFRRVSYPACQTANATSTPFDKDTIRRLSEPIFDLQSAPFMMVDLQPDEQQLPLSALMDTMENSSFL